jgi:hypothetical protein
MYNTFNGWKRQGRVVEIGSRSGVRNEYGDKMFHISQTVRRGSYMGYQVVSRPVFIRTYY